MRRHAGWWVGLAAAGVLVGATAGRAQKPDGPNPPVIEVRPGGEFLRLGDRFVRKDQISVVKVEAYADKGDHYLDVYLVGRDQVVGGAWAKDEDGKALIQALGLPPVPAIGKF